MEYLITYINVAIQYYCNLINQHIIDFKFINIGVVILASISALLIELMFVGFQASSLKKLLKQNNSLKNDLWCYVFDVSTIFLIVGKLLTFSIPYIVGFSIGEVLARLFPVADFINSVPVLFRIGIILLVSELANYWAHRTFHSSKILWELHKYHHTSSEFGVLSAKRDHPMVVPIFSFFSAIPLAFLGSGSSAVGLAGLFVVTVHAMLIHSELKSDWGLFGRWILISPNLHRMHHAADQANWGRNFGFITPVWDRVFGTYYHSEKAMEVLGVQGSTINDMSFWQGMNQTTFEFLKKIFSKSAN